ncbi:MAG: tail fiber domain-containing protein [Saprospiraceae bacterium]|nr:tail fiber domain-containing protein [Saprospiraceae bacterium]
MKKITRLKSVFYISYFLFVISILNCQAQIEVDGVTPGIKVTNANIAGQFSGIEVGIKASNSFIGRAVEGMDNSGSGASYGVRGISTNGTGVSGESNQGAGVYGESDTYRGVWGHSSNNFGVVGTSGSGAGGYFRSDSLAVELKGHLNLQSLTNSHDWRFEINSSDGYLLLFYNNVFKGSFNNSTGNYTSISDQRFKNGISTISNSILNDILSLRPVSYKMVDQEENQRSYGLIAQEVREILPELIEENILEEEKILSISYTELIPILIKGMQEQQRQIDNLTTMIQDQMAAITYIREKLNRKNDHPAH